MPLLRAGPSPGSVTNNSNGLADATLRPPYGIPRRSTAVSFDLPGPNSKTRRKIARREEREREIDREIERERNGWGEGRQEREVRRGRLYLGENFNFFLRKMAVPCTSPLQDYQLCILACIYIYIHILRMTVYICMYVRMYVTLVLQELIWLDVSI